MLTKEQEQVVQKCLDVIDSYEIKAEYKKDDGIRVEKIGLGYLNGGYRVLFGKTPAFEITRYTDGRGLFFYTILLSGIGKKLEFSESYRYALGNQPKSLSASLVDKCRSIHDIQEEQLKADPVTALIYLKQFERSNR